MPGTLHSFGIAGCLYGGSLLSPAVTADTAVSCEQGRRGASGATVDVVREQERSVALFGDKDAAISEVWDLLGEAAESGWDGEDAEPVDRSAAENAIELIRSLPRGLPMPEVAVDPDGEITLDWIISRTRLLTVSVGPTDQLAYAWLNGGHRGRAVLPFDRHIFPQPLIRLIQDVMNADDAPLRIA